MSVQVLGIFGSIGHHLFHKCISFHALLPGPDSAVQVWALQWCDRKEGNQVFPGMYVMRLLNSQDFRKARVDPFSTLRQGTLLTRNSSYYHFLSFTSGHEDRIGQELVIFQVLLSSCREAHLKGISRIAPLHTSFLKFSSLIITSLTFFFQTINGIQCMHVRTHPFVPDQRLSVFAFFFLLLLVCIRRTYHTSLHLSSPHVGHLDVKIVVIVH